MNPQRIMEYINSIRDLEEELAADPQMEGTGYQDHPAWDSRGDALAEQFTQEDMDGASIVWEEGYCDYVSLEEVQQALQDARASADGESAFWDQEEEAQRADYYRAVV